jgi:hypothetical protein
MTLSTNAKEAVLASLTDEAFILLMEIDHPTLTQPIRVARNFENIVSNGETFVGGWFKCGLPSDNDRNDAVEIEVDNVDRAIVDALRAADTAPTVNLMIVMASSPDTIEFGPVEMTMRDGTYDALKVRGSIIFEELFAEPFPGGSFTPASHPGLF